MKKILICMMIAFILLSGSSSAHRMFVGQRMTVDLFVFYDDASPAKNADLKIYQDGKLFLENKTDEYGQFTFVLPGRGTGKWQYEVSSGGHTERGYINIENSSSPEAAALGLIFLMPLAYVFKKRRDGGLSK